MIETTIPHSEFDDPDCFGYLSVVGREGLVVDFVCNECGAVIACARIGHVDAAIHALELNGPLASAICPHCGLVNLFPGFSAVLAYTCEHCGLGVTVGPHNTAP